MNLIPPKKIIIIKEMGSKFGMDSWTSSNGSRGTLFNRVSLRVSFSFIDGFTNVMGMV